MTEFLIESDLAQAVLNYLATRPYQEVFPMVAALQALKPVEEPEETDAP